MRALIEAHGVLSDPPRRALYDTHRHRPAQPAHEHAAGHPHTPPSWRASAEDAEAYDRIYANNDPRGVASFFGILLGLIAFAFLRGSLTGSPGIGTTIALVCAIVFGFAALWCFADPASLARAAERLAPRTPPQEAHGAQRQHTGHPKYHPAHESADEHDAEFERLVVEAVASIPDQFQPYMRNIMVRVRPEPTNAERHEMHLREHQTLFGLYEGVPLTVQGADENPLEVITIYQRPIEQYCHGDREHIRDQVRRTVLHEVAHHFGIDHSEMPEWVR
jgi:predicted Zn-dependent protease with MMP-like domain